MHPDLWSLALLVTTAVHVGFQATVTLLVYPALVGVPPEDWSRAHRLHSRRITPLVAAVYGPVLVSCTAALVTAPGSPGAWAAGAGTAGALIVTAVAAAPTHSRLGAHRTPALLARLLRVDRLRLASALVALAGAVAAVR